MKKKETKKKKSVIYRSKFLSRTTSSKYFSDSVIYSPLLYKVLINFCYMPLTFLHIRFPDIPFFYSFLSFWSLLRKIFSTIDSSIHIYEKENLKKKKKLTFYKKKSRRIKKIIITNDPNTIYPEIQESYHI